MCLNKQEATMETFKKQGTFDFNRKLTLYLNIYFLYIKSIFSGQVLWI